VEAGAAPRARPEDYQPPLTLWSHIWRLALTLLISAAAWGEGLTRRWSEHRLLFWVDVALGAAALILVWWRRRWPFAVAASTATLNLVSGAAIGPATLAGVSLATRRQVVPIVVVGVLGTFATQGFLEVDTGSASWVTYAVNALLTAGMLAWGMYIGSRRELLWTLRQRAVRAEQEQELRAASARDAERARIAREMHDVLAHRISQVSMHAGALAYRKDLASEEMRTNAALIQATANDALTDLRGVLGVLREPGTGRSIEGPQPTYADLPALIEDARTAGMSIQYDDRLATTATGAELPPGAGRTVYRIVQEGLTNARKHAPGAAVTVRLSGSPESGVDLEVCNPIGFTGTPAAPGAGLGLLGLTERAELRDGTLQAERRDGSFVLHAWIPWAP
jgi:signal transduction histidine kinase